MLYEVIPTKIFRTGSDYLTYSSEMPLKPGQIVKIPLGKTSTIGIIFKKTPKKPNYKVKSIEKVLYETPLPEHLLNSITWLSKYYLIPMPNIASLFLPIGLEKKRRQKKEIINEKTYFTQKIPLNHAQKIALEAIESSNEATKLLHGVTGSGKTNIYLKMASECLKQGDSAILLVPEIALTSQLVQIFEKTFKTHVILIHSNQTEAERHLTWEKVLESNSPQIVIGPRSALFAPLKNLGLIIIDEAHESTFYQENSPKYSALRLASFIAKTKNITCLFGTATPLISDYYLSSKKDTLISLSEKAKKTAITPTVEIVDLKNQEDFKKNKYFSDKLLKAIDENLKNNHQTLIFHNRRGSAPMTVCKKCGWQALCPYCFLPLTLHSDTYSLFCHTCGYSSKIPHSCPDCNSTDIIHKGIGTKLLEAELKKLFKTAKIARFDGDNKKTETLNALYEEVKSGKINILIGTQTITKGLDLPNLATVGIIQADSSLSLPDYSAEERTYHLINQVIGRVGRGHIDTASVFIQTYQPNNPIINYASKSDFENFYNYLLKKRQKQKFPPFTFLAKITITMKTETTTIKKIKEIYNFLKKNAPKSVKIMNPAPAFHEHHSTGFTWQIVLKSASRTQLILALDKIDPKLKPSIILDPPSLL